MRRLAPSALLVALALVGARWPSGVAQEASPMAGMAGTLAGAVGLTARVLARIAPAAAPGQEVQLVRVEVDAGATVAAHTHPDAIAICLESGEVVFGVVQGAATLTRAATAATPAAAERRAAAETVLRPGDCLTFEATETVHTLRNPGGPSVLWQAHLYAQGQPATTFLGTPTP